MFRISYNSPPLFKIKTITKRNERKMEKIKSDQEKVLKEILGKKWKNIPQVNEIEYASTFGVKIKVMTLLV